MQEAERLPDASDFGRLLRHFRLAAGLSQEALAERARMSPFAISALERGHRRRPQIKTLELLVGALGLDGGRRAEFEAAARSEQRTKIEAVTLGPWLAASDQASAPNNLPRQATPLVGRDEDLAKLAPLINENPLITLVGAGGVGKTRLALRLGEAALGDSPDGVWLVELAGFGEPISPVESIASTFGLGDAEKRPLLEVVLQHLQSRRLLLILDNCEHVIEEAARTVEALARDAPNLRILATSREPLRVAAEHVYRVPPLAVPTKKALTANDARQYGAVELFAERANAAQAGFMLTDANAVVADICARLDGLPLAIELAATRTSVLCVSEIAERLDQRFSVLTNGRRTSTARQHTLRAMIDWSYDLLPESERKFFRKLGIFAGDFSLEAAATLQGESSGEAPFDLLATLVEKSLVHAEAIGDKTRFRLLESVRAYALEQLAAHGELEATAYAHAQAYLALAERLEAQWDATPDVEWKATAEPELENFRTALRWAFAPGGDRSLGMRLIAALRPVWFTLAPAEGSAWVRTGLGECNESRPSRIRAWLELSAAHLSMVTQQYGTAKSSAERAL
ncbi:MAG TPA: helix-turn-helix domain-containing protein, partial [Candidatus Nitrosotalea sp.]|nr:helix-turn-helix domain-containing protein [Candidatus Nitrosotalea sp.]